MIKHTAIMLFNLNIIFLDPFVNITRICANPILMRSSETVLCWWCLHVKWTCVVMTARGAWGESLDLLSAALLIAEAERSCWSILTCPYFWRLTQVLKLEVRWRVCEGISSKYHRNTVQPLPVQTCLQSYVHNIQWK